MKGTGARDLPSAGINRFRFNGSTSMESQLSEKPPEVANCIKQTQLMSKNINAVLFSAATVTQTVKAMG